MMCLLQCSRKGNEKAMPRTLFRQGMVDVTGYRNQATATVYAVHALGAWIFEETEARRPYTMIRLENE